MSDFQDLPEELILRILSYTEIKAFISCGQVSTRIRRIRNDNSLWMTVNIEKKIVKTELLEMILGKGCMILNITNSVIMGSLTSNIKHQLRVLKLSIVEPSCRAVWTYCDEYLDVLEDLLFSCCSLQHLTLDGLGLSDKMTDGICKNGKTLQKLDLHKCESDFLDQILECCQELKQVNYNDIEGYSDVQVDAQVLAKYIPTNVEILKLGNLDFRDDDVKILLSRCNKIKALHLEATLISDESLTIIRHYLNLTLEELSLADNKYISGTGFLELKSMPSIKSLNLCNNNENCKEIQNLRQHLPHLMIRSSYPWENLYNKIQPNLGNF